LVQAVGNREHLLHLRRLDDHGAPVRAQPNEVERVRHEAIRFCSLAKEAELADSQLTTAARRRRQVCEGCAPAVKPGLVKIRGVGTCDKAPEMRENPLLTVVATAQ
jgi:hypothetical protein